MIDREKVKKALECRKNADKRCGNPCEDTGLCHYAKAIRGLDGEIYKPFICDRERICADALALLKEQEAKPVKIEKNAYGHEFYHCPKCGRGFIDNYYKRPLFCDKCGQAVKWDNAKMR